MTPNVAVERNHVLGVRTSIRFPAAYLDSVVVIVTTAFLVTGVSVLGILQPSPWCSPRLPA